MFYRQIITSARGYQTANSYYAAKFCFPKSKPEDADRFFPQNLVCYCSVRSMDKVHKFNEFRYSSCFRLA